MADKIYIEVDGERQEITQAQLDEMIIDITPFELPKFVRAGDLWDRVTDEEAEQIEVAIAQQPIRIQNIFRTRNEYHMDHELWPLLQQLATQLFGEDRAAEILAPSE